MGVTYALKNFWSLAGSINCWNVSPIEIFPSLPVTNTTSVTATSDDPNAGNNSDFLTTSVSGADVTLTKSVDLPSANTLDNVVKKAIELAGSAA